MGGLFTAHVPPDTQSVVQLELWSQSGSSLLAVTWDSGSRTLCAGMHTVADSQH